MTVIYLSLQKSKYISAVKEDPKGLTENIWSHDLPLLMLVMCVVLNLCNIRPHVHGWTVHVSEAHRVTTLCSSITECISGCVLPCGKGKFESL